MLITSVWHPETANEKHQLGIKDTETYKQHPKITKQLGTVHQAKNIQVVLLLRMWKTFVWR